MSPCVCIQRSHSISAERKKSRKCACAENSFRRVRNTHRVCAAHAMNAHKHHTPIRLTQYRHSAKFWNTSHCINLLCLSSNYSKFFIIFYSLHDLNHRIEVWTSFEHVIQRNRARSAVRNTQYTSNGWSTGTIWVEHNRRNARQFCHSERQIRDFFCCELVNLSEAEVIMWTSFECHFGLVNVLTVERWIGESELLCM